ncbi:hypothetical protein B0H19DRAFT_1085723 [Mycena capillaripes]|nr:hypothetical protein B0H19DRAFT_1085723 [Mycena capillaripes]
MERLLNGMGGSEECQCDPVESTTASSSSKAAGSRGKSNTCGGIEVCDAREGATVAEYELEDVSVFLVGGERGAVKGTREREEIFVKGHDGLRDDLLIAAERQGDVRYAESFEGLKHLVEFYTSLGMPTMLLKSLKNIELTSPKVEEPPEPLQSGFGASRGLKRRRSLLTPSKAAPELLLVGKSPPEGGEDSEGS